MFEKQRYQDKKHSLAIADIFKGKLRTHLQCENGLALPHSSDSASEVKTLSCAHNLYSK